MNAVTSRLLLTTAAVVGFSATASAQDAAMFKTGYYGSLSGGASFLQDSDSSGNGIKVETSFDTGYLFSGAIGYKLGNGFRLEGEVSHSDSDISDQKVTTAGLAIALGNYVNVSGDVSSTDFMANGYYDFKANSNFTPFLMAGVGVAHVSINDAKVANTLIADDSDNVLAFQVGFGVNASISDNVAVGVSYRYMGGTDPTFKDSSGADFDGELGSHNVLATLTYSF